MQLEASAQRQAGRRLAGADLKPSRSLWQRDGFP